MSSKIPVYSKFHVLDRWFASVPGATQPNRLFIHSATSHGTTNNERKLLIEGFPQKTIFESLDEAGFTFGIYYQCFPTTLFYRYLNLLRVAKDFSIIYCFAILIFISILLCLVFQEFEKTQVFDTFPRLRTTIQERL